jgi:hypothetical protein
VYWDSLGEETLLNGLVFAPWGNSVQILRDVWGNTIIARIPAGLLKNLRKII